MAAGVCLSRDGNHRIQIPPKCRSWGELNLDCFGAGDQTTHTPSAWMEEPFNLGRAKGYPQPLQQGGEITNPSQAVAGLES